MREDTLISICIPAYENAAYLKRLLESISNQTYKDFEVIVTDDSNDGSVRDLINTTMWNFSIRYFKNEKALGSPENWNAAVKRAKGRWIKMMHHDDWFSSELALEIFVEKIKKQPGKNFFFCAYKNKYENGKTEKVTPSGHLLRQLILKNPASLLASNIIGPPSVTMYRNDEKIVYDKNLKWLVDIDFYIGYLRNSSFSYTGKSLVFIGVHEEQVTKYSFRNPQIEIPEHLIVLNKLGKQSLNNIIVYDAFWRLIRNLKIASVQELSAYNIKNIAIPQKLKRMIAHQKAVPSSLLSFGGFSKITMLFSYLLSRGK